MSLRIPEPPKPPEKRIECLTCGYRGVESGHSMKKHKRNEIVMPILLASSLIGFCTIIMLMIISIDIS